MHAVELPARDRRRRGPSRVLNVGGACRPCGQSNHSGYSEGHIVQEIATTSLKKYMEAGMTESEERSSVYTVDVPLIVVLV